MLHLLSHHRRKYWERNEISDEEKSILSSAGEIWAFFSLNFSHFSHPVIVEQKNIKIKFQSEACKVDATDEICSLKEKCREIMGKWIKKKCNNLPATVFTGIGVIDKFFISIFFINF